MPMSDFTLPKIDSYAAKRVLAQRIMNNVVQSLIWRDGLGITEKFSDNVMAAQVRIIRQKMPVQKSRTLGENTSASVNDGHFNSLDAEQPITQEYDLPLIEMFDRNVDVSDVLDEMIQIGTLNITVQTLEQQLARLINAYTLAVKVASALNYDYNSTGDELIEWAEDSEELVDKLAEAHQRLDEGSATHGIDTFPQENRIAVFRTKGKYGLLTAGNSVYNVGASRAVELLEIGSAGKLEKAPETNVTGYFGELYNTPLHMASNIIWTLAEEYLDLTAGDLDDVVGIVSASQATGRGVAFQNSVKIIDNPRGQGYRLQPKTRWGVKNWIPEGERLIVLSTFTNPVVSEATELEAVGPDTEE